MTGEPRRWIGLAVALLAIAGLAWRGLKDRADLPPVEAPVETMDVPGSMTTGGEDLEAVLASDPRLQRYLGECRGAGPFQKDTSDPVRLLVERLEFSSSPEPLAQAKYELARMGARAVPELRRFVEERFDRPDRAPEVQNAYEALHQMDVGVPGVRQLLGDGLLHAQQSVRNVAIRALTRHADVYEFDALFDLCTRSIPATQQAIVQAMHTADPRRLEEYLADALLQPGLEPARQAAAALIGPCAASTAERYAELEGEELPLGVRPYYLACRALHGDEAALEALRESLRAENATERSIAAQACVHEGLVDELLTLCEDPDPSLRALAIDTFAAPDTDDEGPTEARRDAVRALLGDPSGDVRRAALSTLVGWGDAAATDQALEWLKGSRGEFRTALSALDRGWKDDPDLARRALDILIGQREELSHRASEELARIENGIALVPLPAAAEYLLELGRAYPMRSRGARSERRNHRHFALKAGRAGFDALVARWGIETDPVRRMDLVEALQPGEDDARRDELRAFLVGILRSDRVHPYEQLQASMRLAWLGPVEEVAPILKRAALDVSHPDVRRGMNCLLWDWYGR